MDKLQAAKAPAKKRGRPRKAEVVQAEVRSLLEEATVDAARLLIETVKNPDAAPNHRLDAAKEVLNRVYGKSAQLIDGELDTTVSILLSEEVRGYAK